MGSKHKLLPWLHSILSHIEFSSAADVFCGSGGVAYLMKAMGKEVYASDFLSFPAVVARAVLANSTNRLSDREVEFLVSDGKSVGTFVQDKFNGIFFTPDDLAFIDLVWERIAGLATSEKKDLAIAALIRACMKKQPRGVFTVGNLPNGVIRYDDGRRDVRLSIRDHFREQAKVLNGLVFDNGAQCTAEKRDALESISRRFDLVYFDPPYVPRSDDNCYVKRYHFLEGLATYWKDGKIMESSKVKKLEKKRTPFSHKRTALQAFDQLFSVYSESTIVLSYSNNGYPDRGQLEELLRKYKPRIEVFEKQHRYHFGTHSTVERALTTEYVLVGSDT